MKKLFAAAVLAAFCSVSARRKPWSSTGPRASIRRRTRRSTSMVAKFEKKTGVKVELSRYSPQESVPKAVAALDSGTPPDVVYGDVFDFQVAGKWASEGRLEDLSDILTPMKASFLPMTLETTYLLNEKTKKRAYYAFPMKRQTMHIQYWKDMLAEAGFKESDIPKTWNAYWDFWCAKAQAGYRKTSGKRIYSVGAPMGVDSCDSFYSFLTYMDAYNVKVVDDNGKLTVDRPKVTRGPDRALRDYTETVAKGCTPPSAVNWKDPDNNVAFHNKQIMMTHNATISIASKWLDDMNNDKLTAEQRAEAKKNYYELIATAGFPNKPDGKPMQYRAAVKVGVVFQNAKNKKRGKEFVAFLMQDENLHALRRGRARPLVPGHQDRRREQVLDRRPAPQHRAQAVLGRHGDLRVHQELEIHHPQQRERVGQGDEPRRHRQVDAGEGGRRDDRPHQGSRRLSDRFDPLTRGS